MSRYAHIVEEHALHALVFFKLLWSQLITHHECFPPRSTYPLGWLALAFLRMDVIFLVISHLLLVNYIRHHCKVRLLIGSKVWRGWTP